MKFILVLSATLLLPLFANAANDLLPEAPWITSMSASVVTCPAQGLDCTKDLQAIRAKLEKAGFIILRTTSCAPKREDTYGAICPGGGTASEVATVYFAK